MNATICRYVLQDLNRGKLVSHRAGAHGMSADQVLRCAIIKILFSFSYEELAFHIVDYQSIRWFCRIGMADKGLKKSGLNKNIKVISEQTWQAINCHILGYTKKENIEKRHTVRVDCTNDESNIHDPKDSNLLWDAVRVLTRLIEFGTYGHRVHTKGMGPESQYQTLYSIAHQGHRPNPPSGEPW